MSERSVNKDIIGLCVCVPSNIKSLTVPLFHYGLSTYTKKNYKSKQFYKICNKPRNMVDRSLPKVK